MISISKCRIISFVLAGWAMSISCACAQWHEREQERWNSMQEWKAKAVAVHDDANAAVAHEVFDRLLRAWDSPRLPPRLYVVNAANDVWAASLDDGSVLITQRAIVVARRDGVSSARLAFVLAHELGHQQADHQWRERSFRLSGDEMVATIPSTPSSPPQRDVVIDNQERQADADGLVLMMLAGYDPYTVVGDSSFFDDWIASVQGRGCASVASTRVRTPACDEALQRARESRRRLSEVATQSALFDLGLQSYAATDYGQALRYFTAFGRLFPAAAVHANIALTHLAWAQARRREMAALDGVETPYLELPLTLSANPVAAFSPVMRSGDAAAKSRQRLQREFDEHIAAAIAGLDKVAQLRPNDATAYLHLAAAYALDANAPMAKGTLDGRYAKRFPPSAASVLVRAAIAHAEGERAAAIRLCDEAIAMLQESSEMFSAQQEAWLYTAQANLAALLALQGERERARQRWMALAQWADKKGLAMLFAAARAQLQSDESGRVADAKSTQDGTVAMAIATLGISPSHDRHVESHDYTLWSDGERLILRRYDNGLRRVSDKSGAIRAEWRRFDVAESRPDVRRVIAKYGAPDNFISGVDRTYLAFRRQRIGFELEGSRVTSWYRYAAVDQNVDGASSTGTSLERNR